SWKARQEGSPVLCHVRRSGDRVGYSLFAAILGVFSVAGILLNALVIIVTLRHKQLRQPLNYALVNLAVADLGCAALGGVPTVVTTAMGYFSLGRIGCVLEAFAVAFFGIAALCSVAVIALDRYVVVCRPLGTVTFQTKHAMAGVAASWVWSFIWNTPPLFGWGGYELEGVQTSCGPDWYSRDLGTRSFIICYFLFCFAIPFSTIVVSYTSLLHKLRQVVKLQMAEGGTTAKAEVQVSRMVVVMVLAFLLTWLPYASFALSVVIIPDLYINPVIAAVPMYLTKCSTVFNPIIYIFMNRQVSRREKDDKQIKSRLATSSSKHSPIPLYLQQAIMQRGTVHPLHFITVLFSPIYSHFIFDSAWFLTLSFLFFFFYSY
uniref:G-protein coupled receptors family 1 profile domain-containing protein n=1 Tax=Denticeps clupeoides TaxID=299321 RepID=A0AAY4EDZ7_9TELE